MAQPNRKNRKRRHALLAIAMFTLVFIGVFAVGMHFTIKAADDEYKFLDSSGTQISSGETFTMRRSTDKYTVLGTTSRDTCTWRSLNPEFAEIQNANADGTKVGQDAVIKAKKTGTAAIVVEIDHNDGTAPISINMNIDVVFSINEYLNGVSGVELSKLYPDDERKSLIMNCGTSVKIGDENSGNDFLKLTFGNGVQAEWVCGNTDVIRYDSGAGKIVAVGAGPTKLTVSWTEGTDTYTDTIDVYVRPQILSEDGSTVLAGQDGSPQTVEVKNGDMVQVTVENDANPQIAIADKLVWVISKGEGENSVLVRDSLGNKGEDWQDINLYYVKTGGEHFYRVDAKAGEYSVQFYVKGTYKDFEDSKENTPACGPVNLQTKVDCEFADKKVTVSLGGTYSLSDAFNIPISVLADPNNFTATIIGSEGHTYVSLDEALMEVRTKHLGEAKIEVTLNSGINPEGLIPGFPTNSRTATVTITVADTFALNIAETKVFEGSEIDFYGIIGSDATAEASQFKWSVSDDSYIQLSSETGQYVTATAKKETPSNSPATVTLEWTDKQGITWVANCTVTIIKSPTNFAVVPDSQDVDCGETITIHTNIDKKSANIDWISSDKSLVTVTPNEGNISAQVTATDKTGSAVITAYNRDNGSYATCTITVVAPITSVSIVQGDTFETTTADKIVQMKATYEPSNATNTDLVWEVRNENPNNNDTLASINKDTGVMNIYKEGAVIVKVEPKYNPNFVYAVCTVIIKENPVASIKPSVESIDMIKGDTYKVETTVTAKDPDGEPSDSTLTWSVISGGENIVEVDQEGNITAKGIGTATVLIEGVNNSGKPAQAYVTVNVRDRLEKIEFDKNSVEVPEKGTYQLNVKFTPDKDVNKTLFFKSSDESVVTVDEKGVLTGVKKGGMATVVCWAEDIGMSGLISCTVTVTDEVIPATSFEISPTKGTIQVGQKLTIKPKLEPANTSDKNFSYVSSDSSIASVDKNGVVTGVKPGIVAISCTPVGNIGDIKMKVCTITVIPAVKLSLNPSSREIAKGKSFTIKKVVTGTNVDKTCKWTTSNKSIATVTSAGKVKGKKYGTCTITCTLTKYNIKATCRVKVAKLRSTVKLNKSSIRINIGQKYKLKKKVWTNSSSKPKVYFTSKNKKIATVGKTSGSIKGKKVGSTIITAKTVDSCKATAKCRVTVIRRATSVKLNKTYAVCYIGRTLKLKATVKPKNASIKKLKWSITDSKPAKEDKEGGSTKVATVLSNGTVTGISEGTVVVQVKTTDGSNKVAKCFVSVVEPTPISSILVAQSNMTMKKGDTAKLSYTVLPNGNSDKVKFASDNKRVAKVTSGGTVKAVGTGTATITIMATSGVTSTVTVNVVAMNKSSVRMRQYDTETLMVTGTDANITWYSANNRVASVSNGKVTGRGVGTTYIYAFVNGCKMGCKVNIVSVNTKKR